MIGLQIILEILVPPISFTKFIFTVDSGEREKYTAGPKISKKILKKKIEI